MPRIQFLRRSVVETMPTPPDVLHARRAEARAGATDDPASKLTGSTVINPYQAPVWYGFESGAVLWVEECRELGRWWAVDLTDDIQARIPLHHARELPRTAPEVGANPHLLPDKLLSAKVADSAMFFRHPEEHGFWKEIVRDPLDETSRLVYADWLDDHDDPDAWVFRERLPFDTGEYQGLKWDEAAVFLPQPNLSWQNLTIQAACSQHRDQRYPRFVHYQFAGGSHLPQFVAYLLVLMRLRVWVASGQ